MTSGCARRGCWEITILAPRWCSSAMIVFESKAFSQQTAELDTFDKWRDPYPRIRTRAIFHVVLAAVIDGRHHPLYLSKYLNIG